MPHIDSATWIRAIPGTGHCDTNTYCDMARFTTDREHDQSDDDDSQKYAQYCLHYYCPSAS
jgi:hypothetical protein